MNEMRRSKRTLTPKQREELLRVLKSRFEKNMNRHKAFNGRKYKRSWKRIQTKYRPSLKWK